MKIAVATTMQPGIYSGGRYLAQILAHALNRAGADVVYLSNNDALFDADFASYDLDRPLRKIIGSEYALPEGFAPDWVVVIPTGGFDQKFYVKALDMAHAHGARVALLSFETPNWFNGMSPFSRSNPAAHFSPRCFAASIAVGVTVNSVASNSEHRNENPNATRI